MAAATRYSIKALMASASKAGGVPASGPGPGFFRMLRLIMLGSHRVGLKWLITYNHAPIVQVHCYEML